MNVIRKFFGPEARAIMRDPAIEVIPGKAVCTVKPGDPYKRKFRVVSCGNYAKTTAESQLYAGGAGAESYEPSWYTQDVLDGRPMGWM